MTSTIPTAGRFGSHPPRSPRPDRRVGGPTTLSPGRLTTVRTTTTEAVTAERSSRCRPFPSSPSCSPSSSRLPSSPSLRSQPVPSYPSMIPPGRPQPARLRASRTRRRIRRRRSRTTKRRLTADRRPRTPIRSRTRLRGVKSFSKSRIRPASASTASRTSRCWPPPTTRRSRPSPTGSRSRIGNPSMDSEPPSRGNGRSSRRPPVTDRRCGLPGRSAGPRPELRTHRRTPTERNGSSA